MRSNIKKEIEELIYRDLALLKTKLDIWEYRDTYFLNGSYDWLFIKYIKDNNIK